MAAISIQQITTAGLVPSYAAAGAGDEFANNGRTFLEVVNGAGAPITVTITSQVSDPLPGTIADNLEITVVNGSTNKIGPFNQAAYNDADGNVQVTYSSTTTITRAAISI